MENKFLLVFVLSIFLVGIVSANGLTITPFHLNISKTYNQNFVSNITIRNTENFNFTNITFENNPYVSIKEIPILTSGENITIPITVKTNLDINKDIRLKGLYKSQIGESHNTYYSNIKWDKSPTVCSINLYKGDKIIFHNENDFDISIRNDNTLELIKLLNANETFDWNLVSPTTIVYSVRRAGFPFGNPCTVNVLATNGTINNPSYDGILKLQVKNIFKQTNLTSTFPQTNYNVSIFNNQQGFIKLINNGMTVANKIKLSGDWFTFSDNNFDLQPGYTRIISYTINLKGKIFNTNQTNKTYIKTINITGNFPTISQDFNLHLNYFQILNSTTNNTSDFLEWIKEHYPELLKPKVIIQYVDNNSRDVNVTTTQEKLNGLATAIFSTQDYSQETYKKLMIALNAINQTLTNQTITNVKNSKDIVSLKNTFNDNNDFSTGIIFVIIFFVILILGGFILKFAYQKRKVRELERWDTNAR